MSTHLQHTVMSTACVFKKICVTQCLYFVLCLWLIRNINGLCYIYVFKKFIVINITMSLCNSIYLAHYFENVDATGL